MYPSAVPGRQSFDGLPTLPDQEASEHTGVHVRRVVSKHRRSFPIRISQSSGQAALPTVQHSSLPEHNLRRKTPSGTVDAGYDGSHIQPSPGPPPLKHMILPVSSNPWSLFHSTSTPSSIQQRWSQSTPANHRDNGVHLHANFTPSALTYNDVLPTSFDTWINHTRNLNLPVTAQYSDLHQPVIRANEHNVRAFCPPPAPISGSLLFGHTTWQSGSSPWDHQNYERNPYFGTGFGRLDSTPSALAAPRDTLFQHPIVYFGNHEMPLKANQNPLHFQWSDQPYLGANIVTPARGTNPHGQTHFREKALQHSYQSYIDLLSFLQANGRSYPTRTGPGTFDSHKLPAYPKPPKLWSCGKFKDVNLTGSTAFPLDNIGGSSPQRTRRYTLDSDRPLHNMVTYHPAGYSVADIFSLPQKPATTDCNLVQPSFSSVIPVTKPIPVANALSSLDLLENLCEQSGWKWVEGMLVGGCLQYGLERYDDALKWFSNIVTVDSRNVEAITHMGAALYCLDRQDEAEQNWLQAVKLRPSYLDATEHLVGHLYKNRGGEAVEVISYVQRALSCVAPDMRPLRHNGVSSGFMDRKSPLLPRDVRGDSSVLSGAHGTELAGFASSGYMLPGIDNARILALVHAKGTILHGQRDIKRASEAFQEAVLISVGRRVSGIQDLIRRIQLALPPQGQQRRSQDDKAYLLQPLMLPPEEARHTARLVFGSVGELPGLVFLRNELSKRAAVQTTSNSLLSLAKILQDAMSSGSVDSYLFRGSSQVGDILALYYLSLSLQESPSTANNVGILLAGIQQVVATSTTASTKALPQSSIPGITPGSGLALALAYYNYGLGLDPNHVHLHTNLGSLLKDVGQLDLAIQMYERAVSCDGTFDIALTNLANAIKDKGRINDAILYYRRAVNANPGFAEAVCGLFTALNSVCNWHGRGGVMLESGKYDRWHVDSEGRLTDVRASGCSSGLTKRVVDIVVQQLKDASHWGLGMLQEPAIFSLTEQLQHLCKNPSFRLDEALRQWAGQPWEGSRLVRLIERATSIIQRNWYVDLNRTTGKGQPRYLRPRLPQNLAVPSAPTVLPFHTFTSPLTASHIRAIAQRNALRISCSALRSPWISATIYPPPAPPSPHLNVGYLSSDFNNHPLAHLMQSAFGFHNPSRVRAICYATTLSDGSVHRQQIENEAPVFRDVSNWPPDKLVEQITRDNIHILVNLNGYTRGARNEIFAARPAPIQMSFMGFAGTLGAEWCDYILADKTAIPSTTLRPWRDNVSIEDVFCDDNEATSGDWMYSENVIFCRDTFFCCDHAQSCASGERGITWAEVERRRWEMRQELFPGIKDDVVILGNFNQLYKIDPTTFRTWLRILARAPRAVLWLLRFPEPGENNLRATARAWAGPEVASRIVFTDVAPKSQHISRARVCDLFLDTPECNAHTTAADILWSSTPLLTLPRYSYKMCSRMAASILQGALPRSVEGQRAAAELISDTEEEYEQRATDLANGLTNTWTEAGYSQSKGRLADMRKLLWDNKWHCGLFDTRRWVGDLEIAYEVAWQRWVTGTGGDIFL
ncbi:hypothetical protein QQS21_001041 [Conoideocrella luteorostrata]|uniref:protein O-GlcNAc transferase n=1 Tax=Conoideocrella luteorostrata TaxID=1105319 RepID=A0AAJ0G257_9HYPO|nr:hypothetical protein QQS21_001041 [Conoideocrella luteorostrata]